VYTRKQAYTARLFIYLLAWKLKPHSWESTKTTDTYGGREFVTLKQMP
jgi:hypothetical protein